MTTERPHPGQEPRAAARARAAARRRRPGRRRDRARPAATIDDPYQASQQTLLEFGKRSHWLQPWRGYLETVPARRVTQGLGIVFNPPPGKADKVAAQAAAAGLRYARLEISWCRVSDTEPARLTGMSSIRRLLLALKKRGLRPLILLNGNDGCPGPLRKQKIRLTAAARAGDRQIAVDQASARAIVPGHTGLDRPGGKAAAYLFTNVSGTTVTLSRPLAQSLSTGSHQASTLRYQPFTHPGGPGFEDTMAGWLEYVALATSYVKQTLGSDDFDVEVWNELSFGSDFLDAGTYYNPPAVQTDPDATERAMLERTLTYVRDPSHGLQDVDVGDGFSNQRPWDAGSNVPAGLTAIDKHPYPPRRVFPRDAVFNQVAPVNAADRPTGPATRPGAGTTRSSPPTRPSSRSTSSAASRPRRSSATSRRSPRTSTALRTAGTPIHPARLRPSSG